MPYTPHTRVDTGIAATPRISVGISGVLGILPAGAALRIGSWRIVGELSVLPGHCEDVVLVHQHL